MTTPYNLRINPRKSAKLIGDTDEETHLNKSTTTDLVDPSQNKNNTNTEMESQTASNIHTTVGQEGQHSEAIGGVTHILPSLDQYTTRNIEPTPHPVTTTLNNPDTEQLSQLIKITTQMAHQIQTVQNQIQTVQNQVQTVPTEIQSKMKQLNINLETNLTHKMQESITALESRIEEKMSKLELRTQNQNIGLKNEIITQVNQKFEEQNYKIESLEEQIPKIQSYTEQQLMKYSENLEDHIDNQIQTVTQQMNTHIKNQETYNEIIKEHTLTISNQNATINQIKGEITQIKEKPITPELNQLPEIIVNYIGDHPNSNTNKIPHFHSKTRNPPEFLEQFDKYYESYSKRNTRDCLTYLELVEQCFEGTSAMWFQIIKAEIKDVDDFKTKFLKQFWSSDIQRQIKKRIEIEKYRSEGKLTMTEYFIDRTLTLKSMLPPLAEIEIIEILSNNFNDQIRASVIVQNVQTFERFIELLNREDMYNKTERVKRNSNEYRPNTNTQTQHHQSQNRTPRNGNYDRYNKFVPSRQSPYPQNHNSNYTKPNYKPNYVPNNNNQHQRTNTTYGNRVQEYNHNRRQEGEQHFMQHIQVDTPNHPNNPNRHPTEDQNRWTRQLISQRSDTTYPNTNIPNQSQPSLSNSPSRTPNTRDTGSVN